MNGASMAVAESVAKILGAVFIPCAIAYAGHVWAKRTAAVAEGRLHADWVRQLVTLLASDRSRERMFAVRLALFYSNQPSFPGELLAALAATAEEGEHRSESQGAQLAIESVARAHRGDVAQRAADVLQQLGPVVYVHYPDAGERGAVERVRQALRTARFRVPAAELVTAAPSSSQVRYFHPEDANVAAEIVRIAASAGVVLAPADFTHSSVAARAPAGLAEVWIAPRA